MSHSTVVLVKNMYIYYKFAQCCFAEIEPQQAETESYSRDIHSKTSKSMSAADIFALSLLKKTKNEVRRLGFDDESKR